ncbi:MAG: WecB/TagA/CpsF family glycosyltransferase [Spirochaetota bacterium]|nr:WecB/TagA/CpsF family glycosyltransferase [Spirochaetota bacterium]
MQDDISYYNSWKEDRDLVLEYNQTSLDDANVVNILGIGIDNLTRNQAVVKVMRMIEKGGFHHVISFNPYKIKRMKSNPDLSIISSSSSLHLASGAGIKWASKKIGSQLKESISIISFIMDIIRIAEINEYTIFLVGGKSEIVEKAFFNIRKSFPKIRIVGRHGGYFNEDREKSVIEAIRKSNADIVFVGLGFPKEDIWIYKIKNEFKNGVFISIGGSLDVISGEIKKAPAFFMKRGLDWFYRIITRPWRFGRLLTIILFFIQSILKRIFK